MTEWEEFEDLDLNKTSELMKTNIILDMRNLLNLDKKNINKFKYYGLGN